MKLTAQARQFINHVVENATTDNTINEAALAMALSMVYVDDFANMDNREDLNEALYNRMLGDVSAINSEVIIKCKLDSLIELTRNIMMARWCAAGASGYKPKLGASTTPAFPLANLFGFTYYLSDGELATLSHPELPKLVVGWNSVVACLDSRA